MAISEERRAELRRLREEDLERRKQAKRAEREARKAAHAKLSKLPKKTEDAPEDAPDTAPGTVVPRVEQAEVIEAAKADMELVKKEAAKKKIVRFYEDCLDSEELNVRDKLLAAQAWGKIMGLEKQEIHLEVSPVDKWVGDMREKMASAPAPWTAEAKALRKSQGN